MTAIETLERAISKLATLRDGSAPLPWSIEEQEDASLRPLDRFVLSINDRGGEEAVSQMGCNCCDYGLAGVADTFELIAALSRTVEPLLALLSKMLDAARATGEAHPAVLDLARAILGEETDDAD